MKHPRTEIRQAVTSLLMNRTSAGGQVFDTRINPYKPEELPCINVQTENETFTPDTFCNGQRTFMREVQLVISCIDQAATGSSELVDNMALEIEGLLRFNPSILLQDIMPVQAVREKSDNGDCPVSALHTIYTLKYRAVDGGAIIVNGQVQVPGLPPAPVPDPAPDPVGPEGNYFIRNGQINAQIEKINRFDGLDEPWPFTTGARFRVPEAQNSFQPDTDYYIHVLSDASIAVFDNLDASLTDGTRHDLGVGHFTMLLQELGAPDDTIEPLPDTQPRIQVNVDYATSQGHFLDPFNNLLKSAPTSWRALDFEGQLPQRDLDPSEIDPDTNMPKGIPSGYEVVQSGSFLEGYEVLLGESKGRFTEWLNSLGPLIVRLTGGSNYIVQAPGGIPLTGLPDDAQGRKLFRFQPPADHATRLFLQFSALDANDLPRPEVFFEGRDPEIIGEFAPEFLDSLNGVSTIRFLDWFDSNLDRSTHPEQLATQNDIFSGNIATKFDGDELVVRRGIALRTMFDLCAEKEATPWLHIPPFFGASKPIDESLPLKDENGVDRPLLLTGEPDSTTHRTEYVMRELNAIMTGNGPNLWATYLADEYEASDLVGMTTFIKQQVGNESFNRFAFFELFSILCELIGKALNPAWGVGEGEGWLLARYVDACENEIADRNLPVILINQLPGQTAVPDSLRALIDGIRRYATDNGQDASRYLDKGKPTCASYFSSEFADTAVTPVNGIRPAFYNPILESLGYAAGRWDLLENDIAQGARPETDWLDAAYEFLKTEYVAEREYFTIPWSIARAQEFQAIGIANNVGDALAGLNYPSTGAVPDIYEGGWGGEFNGWLPIEAPPFGDAKYKLHARLARSQQIANAERYSVKEFMRVFGPNILYSKFGFGAAADAGNVASGNRPGPRPFNTGKFGPESNRRTVVQWRDLMNPENY